MRASHPPRTGPPPPNVVYQRIPSRGLWGDLKSGRWVVHPASAFKLALVPIALHMGWSIFAPYFAPPLGNPFAPLLFISHRVPGTGDGDVRYLKGYLDLVYIAYYVVVWSFVRQLFVLELCPPLARTLRLKNMDKLDRFGEQVYAFFYWGFAGIWGMRIMSRLPTWWYRTEHFWVGYPHWAMPPELKIYYLLQAAYWLQQLLVMVLRLERPRTDHYALVAHHAVTLWLVGWSYLINLTRIGNAVFVSMDVTDIFLALTLALNYLQWEKSKAAAFVALFCIWSYFRIWLNAVMLWSVWAEFELIPEHAKRWHPPSGAWLVWWMQYQVFAPLLLLLGLNFYWYMFVLRTAKRALFDAVIDDDRSDDECEDEADDGDKDDNNGPTRRTIRAAAAR